MRVRTFWKNHSDLFLELCEDKQFEEVVEREMIRTINNQLHNKVRDLVPDRYRFIVQGKLAHLSLTSQKLSHCVRAKRQRLQHFFTLTHEQRSRFIHVRQLCQRRYRRRRNLSRSLPRIITNKQIFYGLVLEIFEIFVSK